MEDRMVTIEVRRLTIELATTLESELCSICQNGFRIREFLVGLTCGHGYHRECLVRWTNEVSLQEQRASCPNCRMLIDTTGLDATLNLQDNFSYNTNININNPQPNNISSLIALRPSNIKFTKRFFMNLLDTESILTSGLLPSTFQNVQCRFCEKDTGWTKEATTED